MTDTEKAIVMAATGCCMLTGDKFNIFHEYVEKLLNRPVYSHEFAIPEVWEEIKEKSYDDFVKLCNDELEVE